MSGWCRRVGLPVRDPLFLAALLAGPVGWGLLALMLPLAPDPGRAVVHASLFLLVVLVYPVLEELVFRGLVQGGLVAYWGLRGPLPGVSWANLAAALAFAAAHLIHHPPLWAVLVFAPGLVFGFFRDRYNSVLPGCMLHIFYNAGFFLLFPVS